jgi:hypothetical protein
MACDHGPVRRALAPVLLLVVACSNADGDAGPERASVLVRTARGEVELAVEIADTPEKRALGLMHREDLAPYDGMAFIWAEPTQATFWMKDTLTPLSIAFWDERGRIVSIVRMEPCRTEDCPSYEAPGPILGAIEVEQGRFGREGIEVGDLVELVPAGT